jgi:hypothetical protein
MEHGVWLAFGQGTIRGTCRGRHLTAQPRPIEAFLSAARMAPDCRRGAGQNVPPNRSFANRSTDRQNEGAPKLLQIHKHHNSANHDKTNQP